LHRRKVAWTFGLILGIGVPAAIGYVRHRQALQIGRLQQQSSDSARERESMEASLALQKRISDLRAAFGRAHAASQPHYLLLAALAKATPTKIALRELSCDGDGFRIRGHVYEKAGRPDDPLIPFCRDMAMAGAPWRFPGAPEVADGDFIWRGVFQPDSAALPGSAEPNPPSAIAVPEPGNVAQWERAVSAARAQLPSRSDFDDGSQGWSRHWIVLAQSADRLPDVELRHYALAYDHPSLGSWSDIVETLRRLCAENGVTVDSLALAAAPDGSDAFAEAQITLTARLRL
jgi:hypothetical protein